MKNYGLFILCFTLTGACGFFTNNNQRFIFIESGQGFELSENGKPVYFYQRQPKTSDNLYQYNNYLHPLYSLDGDTLTEEFPEDHPHHRGVYWAWNKIHIDNQSIADGWVMKNLIQDVYDVRTSVDEDIARLDIDVHWKSSIWKNGTPVIHEHSSILVHSMKAGARILDFEITLSALVPGVSIGGSDDEKGYGGFSLRFKLPDDLVFTSKNGTVIPQTLQMDAGPWLTFTGSIGSENNKDRITLFCHPDTPNYPAPWILRQKSSMQNVVYPGRENVELKLNQPVVLSYRLVLHREQMEEYFWPE